LFNTFINYRLEAAEKLGFKNYGELSLITKMAPSISVIEDTLLTILDKGTVQHNILYYITVVFNLFGLVSYLFRPTFFANHISFVIIFLSYINL